MYISVMKKLILVLMVLAVLAGTMFANGTPEEQRIFFDNLIRNSQMQNNSADSGSRGTSTGSEIISRDMATLERLYQYVEKNYLYDIDYAAVYEAMATAMFSALGDKYSYYVKAEKSGDYAEEVSGTYGGLGIYFYKTTEAGQDPADEKTLYAVISQVFPNAPCSRAGLKAGDMITEIDGESVIPLDANECSKRMKGTPGTSVTLSIKRGESIFKVDLTREKVTTPTVEYAMIDGRTAYLRILEFSKSTYLAISKALDNLSAKGMQKLIIDLRNNPGGDVDSALAIADLFISNSDLMYLTYKDTSKNAKFSASNTVAVQPDVDIAILINGGTASSAELFSSMMRDTGRAVIIGSKSFGKGVMQLVSTFGDGFISLTTASFTGPKDVAINKEGVLPDIEIEDLYVTEDEVKAYTELINNDVDLNFVKENPEFTDENVHKFAEQNASTGLRDSVLFVVARNAYLSEMNYDERPLFDIKYDVVCKKAYEYLQTYETAYGTAGGNGKHVVNF